MIDFKALSEKITARKESEARANPPITLSPEQQQVATDLANGRNLLITGSAGVGKSTLLKKLVEEHDISVTASTGIAAVGVGGMTIHSWAGVGLADRPARDIANGIVERKGDAYDRIRRTKVLAIDEISMIGSETFTVLDWVFRYVRREPGAPFGGMQILCLGDFLQLPAVGQAPDGTRFAFESPSWKESQIKTCLLTKVFRQQDEAFSSALNAIRMGEVTESASNLLNSRYGPNALDSMPELKAVIVHTHNADVDAINDGILRKLPGEPQSFHASDTGRPAQVLQLQKHCLAPAELVLKEGAQVMLLKNLDPYAGLANGSVGTVTGFAKYGGDPMVKFANGTTETIGAAKWEIKEGDSVLATRQQIPLRLAWAITAHKAQGCTLDKIQVHLKGVFEDGQAYVALSRARTLEGLLIASGGKSAIRANKDAVEFYRRTLTEEPVEVLRQAQLLEVL